mgnify:CR=1 FL=1
MMWGGGEGIYIIQIMHDIILFGIFEKKILDHSNPIKFF